MARTNFENLAVYQLEAIREGSLAPERGRQDVAWGVSPRTGRCHPIPASPPRAPPQLRTTSGVGAAPGVETKEVVVGDREPGAHAPGYILSPLRAFPDS